MKTIAVLMMGLAVSVLQGCVLFSNPPWEPVVEDEIGNGVSSFYGSTDKRVGTLATVAQRRLALIKFSDGTFCAEPPPDVADSLSAALSTGLAGGNGKIQIEGSVASSFATAAKQLFYRSQGLQLYRDGVFSLCAAHLNGAINKNEYLIQHKGLLDIAKTLIEIELPYMKDIRTDTVSTPQAPPLQNPGKTQGTKSPTQSGGTSGDGSPSGGGESGQTPK